MSEQVLIPGLDRKKTILIYGHGLGKTLLAECLATYYRSLGAPFKLLSLDGVASACRQLTAIADFSGFVVMYTNLPVESFADFDLWQTIEVQGGSVLKHGDFFETATAGLGE